MATDNSSTIENNNKKFNLTLLNGTGYIFNVNDYLIIRQKYRILGGMVGTACDKGFAADDSSMPVEFSVYETRLLVEKGIAQLVAKERTETWNTMAQEKEGNKTNMEMTKGYHFNHSYDEYDLLNEEASDDDQNCHDNEIAGTFQDDDEQAGNNNNKSNGHTKNDKSNWEAPVDLDSIDANTERTKSFEKITLEYSSPHTICLPYRAPATFDPIKYRIFCDFWQRGKYITGGDTFGADFLIYPGDPLLYHASHLLIIMKEPQITPLQLIAKVRLSVVVNKYCIFAYVDKQQHEVASNGEEAVAPTIHYQTVLWDGNRSSNNDCDSEMIGCDASECDTDDSENI